MTRPATQAHPRSRPLLWASAACILVAAVIYVVLLVRGDEVHWWNGLMLVAIGGQLAASYWIQSSRTKGLVILAMGVLAVIAASGALAALAAR